MMHIVSSLMFAHLMGTGDANYDLLLPGDEGLDDFGLTLNPQMVTEKSDHWYMTGNKSTLDAGWAIKVSNDDYTFQSTLSTISIQIDGSTTLEIDGKKECDMFFGIGDGSKYISYLVDFDGGVWAGDLKNEQAVWSYPGCGEGMPSGDVDTLLDNWLQNWEDGNSEYNRFWAIRSVLAGGDLDNWSSFSSEPNDDTWPITLEITNDVDANQVTFRHFSSSLDHSCTFDGAFDTNTPVTMGLMPDLPDDMEISSIALSRTVSGTTSCSASICAHGDNSLEIWSSTDGSGFVQVSNADGWGTTTEIELTDISDPTTLRFQVDDNDHRGGLLATVRVQCDDGYDRTMITDDGNSDFDVVYSLSGNTVMSVFTPFGNTDSANWNTLNTETVQCMDPEAFWMWNGVDTDNVVFDLDLFPEDGASAVSVQGLLHTPMDHTVINGGEDSKPWTVAVSGKDLVIFALFAINLVVLTSLCFVCARPRSDRKRRKYQKVQMMGDSELEEIRN